MKLSTRISNLIKTVRRELNRVVTRVRVFTNCLLLYFENGSPRFYSKKGENWGDTGSDYFVAEILSSGMKQAYQIIGDLLSPKKQEVVVVSDTVQLRIKHAVQNYLSDI